MLLSKIIEALWFILPAYVANSIAIDVSGLPVLRNYSTPIDFGKSYKGRRILGDGKTWRGFICGILGGTIAGFIMGRFQSNITFYLPEMNIVLGFMLGTGAMIGDLFGSFVKRRMGYGRGANVPLLDMFDYVLGAFLFAAVVTDVNKIYLLIIIIVTIPFHIIANYVAYTLKLKKNPW